MLIVANDFNEFTKDLNVSVGDELLHRDQDIARMDAETPSSVLEKVGEKFEDDRDSGQQGLFEYIGEQVVEGGSKVGRAVLAAHTFESEAARTGHIWWAGKYGVGDKDIEITVTNPETGLEEVKVVSQQGYEIQQMYKQQSEADMAFMGENIGWDRKMDTVLVMAGLAVGSMTPTALLLAGAVGVAFGPVVGALGLMGKLGWGLTKTIRASSGVARAARAANVARKVARPATGLIPKAALARHANAIAKKLAIPAAATGKALKPVAKAAGVAAVGSAKGVPLGVANALEEVVIHTLAKQREFKYDLGPAMAMGFFAPAVFGGIGGILGETIKAVKKPKLKVEKTVPSPEVDAPPLKLHTFVDDLQLKVGSAFDITAVRKVLTDAGTPKTNLVLKQIDALDSLGKSVGRGNVEKYFIDLAESMHVAGIKLDIGELFPILKSPGALRTHIAALRKAGKLPKKGKLNNKHLNTILESDVPRLERYVAKNSKKAHQPRKQRYQESDPKAQKTYDDEVVELAKASDDVSLQALGRTSDDVSSAIDTFFKCLSGVADGD